MFKRIKPLNESMEKERAPLVSLSLSLSLSWLTNLVPKSCWWKAVKSWQWEVHEPILLLQSCILKNFAGLHLGRTCIPSWENFDREGFMDPLHGSNNTDLKSSGDFASDNMPHVYLCTKKLAVAWGGGLLQAPFALFLNIIEINNTCVILQTLIKSWQWEDSQFWRGMHLVNSSNKID